MCDLQYFVRKMGVIFPRTDSHRGWDFPRMAQRAPAEAVSITRDNVILIIVNRDNALESAGRVYLRGRLQLELQLQREKEKKRERERESARGSPWIIRDEEMNACKRALAGLQVLNFTSH